MRAYYSEMRREISFLFPDSDIRLRFLWPRSCLCGGAILLQIQTHWLLFLCRFAVFLPTDHLSKVILKSFGSKQTLLCSGYFEEKTNEDVPPTSMGCNLRGTSLCFQTTGWKRFLWGSFFVNTKGNMIWGTLKILLFIVLKLLHMAQKPFASEASKSGLLFHNLSKILHLLLSLKTKSNLGLERTAAAECAKLLSQT